MYPNTNDGVGMHLDRIDGYWKTTIKHEVKLKHIHVHKFIWECFNQRLQREGFVIHHIDGDRSNACKVT